MANVPTVTSATDDDDDDTADDDDDDDTAGDSGHRHFKMSPDDADERPLTRGVTG